MSKNNNEEIIQKVIDWGYARHIHTLHPRGQIKKLEEEYQELQDAFAWNDEFEVKDAIGDLLVVCIMVATQLSYPPEDIVKNFGNQFKRYLADNVFFAGGAYITRHTIKGSIQNLDWEFDELEFDDNFNLKTKGNIHQLLGKLVQEIICTVLDLEYTPIECLEQAYESIKDRKGLISNEGLFVKFDNLNAEQRLFLEKSGKTVDFMSNM